VTTKGRTRRRERTDSRNLEIDGIKVIVARGL
jgi:hypothetical protein